MRIDPAPFGLATLAAAHAKCETHRSDGRIVVRVTADDDAEAWRAHGAGARTPPLDCGRGAYSDTDGLATRRLPSRRTAGGGGVEYQEGAGGRSHANAPTAPTLRQRQQVRAALLESSGPAAAAAPPPAADESPLAEVCAAHASLADGEVASGVRVRTRGRLSARRKTKGKGMKGMKGAPGNLFLEITADGHCLQLVVELTVVVLAPASGGGGGGGGDDGDGGAQAAAAVRDVLRLAPLGTLLHAEGTPGRTARSGARRGVLSLFEPKVTLLQHQPCVETNPNSNPN